MKAKEIANWVIQNRRSEITDCEMYHEIVVKIESEEEDSYFGKCFSCIYNSLPNDTSPCEECVDFKMHTKL